MSSSEVLADAASTSRWRSKKWRRRRFLGPPRPARRQRWRGGRRGRVVQPAKNDESKDAGNRQPSAERCGWIAPLSVSRSSAGASAGDNRPDSVRRARALTT